MLVPNTMEWKDTVILYFRRGVPYKDIADIIYCEYGKSISVRHIKRVLNSAGFFRRKNYSDLHCVVDFIENESTMSGQLHGYRWMHLKCLMNGLCVTRETVRVILRELDPEGVDLRRRRRLRRRRYVGKGPNYIWHLDGNDKLKPFGIGIHGCIDGFSRKMIWVKANSTNNDPYVVAGYFITVVNELGGHPRRIRADYGTENGNIEIIQKALRMDADACFLYGSSNLNQRIEAWWRVLRQQCLQFWMNCFEELKDNGHYGGLWYEKDLIRICFLKLIQVSYQFLRHC